MAIIYKFTSPSGKHYIGLTSSTMERRWRQHVTLYNKLSRKGVDYRGNSATPILFYAFDKYNPNLWERKILFETDNLEEAKSKEIEFIAEYKTTNPNYGYNVLVGGQTGWAGKNLSENHKEKQSKSRISWYDTEEGKLWKEQLSQRWSNTENNPSTLRIGQPGFAHTEESKAKISAANKGRNLGVSRDFTEEHCKNISKAKKGKKLSPEHKEKVVNALVGRKQPKSQKQKVADANSMDWLVTTPDGKEIKITNLRQFCKENNLSQGSLTTYGKSKGFKVQKLEI